MTDRKIVTGFSMSGYKEYGQRMLDSYYGNQHDLIVYTEGFDLAPHPDIESRRQEDIPGLMNFIYRHHMDQRMTGRQSFEKWKDKEKRSSYSYRFDAVKFCRMVYTMWDAARHINNGIMIWLDGDTVIRKSLPDNLFERFLPALCDYAYLGREPKHTETGFLVFRLPQSFAIIEQWKEFYEKDSFTDFKEWHSAYLFDRAREMFPQINGHNLTPGGRGHVIFQCEAGEWFDHRKGNRKSMKESPEARKMIKR